MSFFIDIDCILLQLPSVTKNVSNSDANVGQFSPLKRLAAETQSHPPPRLAKIGRLLSAATIGAGHI
ncbi:hypothetical protein [Rhizobium sp. 007]|uniref:hypothetical protein n=1 Tax=Rhizobium sp. 007 TaxID=2785056 RepID=UPI00188E59FB|nr:hypothetical protein [Rhizobium sp. 007]QPB23706.1 hypothetical protein ISN39_30035 [Rhizobium sp. 007]